MNSNNNSLVFLYRGELTKPPIAVVNTVTVGGSESPDIASVVWRIEEGDPRLLPVIAGWHIPGYTGWEIIGVVPKGSGLTMVSRR